MNLRTKLKSDDVEPLRQLLRDTGVFTSEEVDVGVELAELTLAGEDGYHWVMAEDDGKLLGVICYGSVPLTEGTWDLYWILRSPGASSRGVAAQLLKTCEEDLRRNQARLLVLNTSSTPPYKPARDYYIRNGFTLAARLPEYYRPGDDLCIYTKRIE
jgi:ribosomal protein S18 acetylase RimI-like enzyme